MMVLESINDGKCDGVSEEVRYAQLNTPQWPIPMLNGYNFVCKAVPNQVYKFIDSPGIAYGSIM